ncbi:uncharacterized protein V1510DRAFT_304141 [Dipodascopsis tothii]|uniref:uncharacterized protein n=1 Tax=Dipodascopsis tothii TaxID=44089 RepID=UPI0034CD3057
MRFNVISAAAVAIAASSALVSAQPAGERRGLDFHTHHRHARDAKADRRDLVQNEKRAVDVVVTYVTVVVDENGNTITDDTQATSTAAAVAYAASPESETTSAYVAPTTSSTYVAPTTSSTYVAPTTSSTYVAPTTSTYVAPTTSTFATSTTSESASSTYSSASSSATLADYEGPYQTFSNGTIPCDTFPAGQGVVAADWLGFGGWTGVQLGDASGGNCTEGAYCSYACQPGMSKTQWPTDQPADGESRGGLLCQNGYLYLTNSDSDYLCAWGQPTANIVSEISQGVAICRTDYPGTENMVVPTWVEGGATEPLTVVDEESYYQWQGKLTSAQYYVNIAGVSVEDGCIWGTPGSDVGNYSPLNFGAGYVDGVSYLALIPNPNAPSGSTLGFNIKIVASEGSTVNGECTYIDGVLSNSAGCTVAVTNGSANFVLY